MEIKTNFINKHGQRVDAVYRDVEDESELDGVRIKGARAYCFHGDKLVLVHEAEGHWGMPGGAMDEGEDAWMGIRREVSEETNMEVLRMKIFAVIENGLPDGDTWKHAWAVCIVEPKGPFARDPGGEISEIKEIRPEEWLAYPERTMTEIRKRIFDRAMEIRATL